MEEAFWGEQTATIDWCEANYEVTGYIVEFWSTISNSVLILFPIYSLYWTYTHSQFNKKKKRVHGLVCSTQFKIPKSVILIQISLITVGLGSWMFHMTLLYPMQLLDELPMIYGTAIQVYGNYDLMLAINEFEEKSTSVARRANKSVLDRIYGNRAAVFSLLFFYCFISTLVYIWIWNNPIFHEICYGVLAFIVIAQSFILINRINSDKRIYFTGLCYYILGFTLWNIDNNFCVQLNACQSAIERFLAISEASHFKAAFFNSLVVVLKSVFELHALWHVFTGYASYMAILFLTDLNYRFHLQKANQSHVYEEKKPISLKYSVYYYLNNNLVSKSRKLV